jgi:hypothetical protein
MKVRTEGLAPGTYTATVTDGSSVVTTVGTFVVPTATTTASWGEDDGDDNGNGTEARLSFPAGFDVTTVASVQIADSTGATVLSGSASTTGVRGDDCDHNHQVFDLQPTAAAPAGVSGRARVKVPDDEDDSSFQASTGPTLKVETQGLAAATYTVSVTSLSTGASTTLGTFDVAAVGTSTTDDDGETEAEIAFPAGFNTLDIASVQVADSTGNVLLSGTGSVPGCGVAGSEEMDAKAVLTATSNAPAGAIGAARLDADDQEGTNTARLIVVTRGLAAGTYTVSITSSTDGSVSVLGTFDVAAASRTRGDDGEVKFGTHVGLPLPSGFNGQDVAGVQVADSTGVAMLTGSFTNTASVAVATFAARVRVTPGPAAPSVMGRAALNSHVSRHVMHQAFALSAVRAPRSAMLVLKVNGNPVGNVKTNRNGAVGIRTLPKSATKKRIRSVSLETSTGSQVLSVHF